MDHLWKNFKLCDRYKKYLLRKEESIMCMYICVHTHTVYIHINITYAPG